MILAAEAPPTGLWDVLLSRADNPFVLFFLILVLVFGAVSKRAAALKGPLGALARWWSGRQVAKVERERQIFEVTHKAQRAREQAENRAERARDGVRFEQMEAELKWLEREITDMRRRDRHRDKQARDHASWDNLLISKLQSAGIDIPGPPPPLYLDLAPLYVPEEGSQ